MGTRPAPIRINDPADERIAEFVSIRERDLTGRTNRFIAEGTVVLNAVLAAGAKARFSFDKLFILEKRLAGLEGLLQQLPAEVPVYTANRQVMDQVTGFAMHRGVLAVGRHSPPANLETFLAGLPDKSLLLACIGIANHDNMGSIFRNAGVFGADGVVIDQTSCDPLYRKSIRVSVGAALRVPFCRTDNATRMVQMLQNAGFEVYGLSPAGSADIANLQPKDKVALIVGTEGPGLGPEILEIAHTARIPQAPGMDSLNVATATGVALWQMATQMGRLN